MKKIYLKDYLPYPFKIPKVNLFFDIYENSIIVNYSMIIEPYPKAQKSIFLDGIDIKLLSIAIDGKSLSEDSYIQNKIGLVIKNIPNVKFLIDIKCEINPYYNKSLEGLYVSNNIITSQCEAEGFRRICFYPDRPDVLSKFTVTIEADLRKYPILLSNGNKIFQTQNTIIKEGRHQVVWDDPFPKPSYLFALVAGDLRSKKSEYQTNSGRSIDINIYTENKNLDLLEHATNSLKKAMRWDESTYNLEYDLNEYNIVAIRHFNMGAMENKGLNIFNSKLIIANPEISTDYELLRVESVVAHEYFHNWTGNRITCRDWFQLSLKEGLTVFRDQSFTSDIHSSSLKRIEDVSLIRNTQFVEDSGPTSHAVQPHEYVSIDNFYTTTIYEKGAEIVRMLFILLGSKFFMAGMKEFVKTFDGQAVTTSDFVKILLSSKLQENSHLNININQFLLWYKKAGTPHVQVNRHWNSEEGKLTIKFTQSISEKTSFEEEFVPFVIPIKLALINLRSSNIIEDLYVLDKIQGEYIFYNLPRQNTIPIVSIFRGLSAPVKCTYDLSDSEIIHLLKNDNDAVSRWDSSQTLLKKIICDRANDNPNLLLEKDLTNAIYELFDITASKDPELLAKIMTFPIQQEIENSYLLSDPIKLYKSKSFLLCKFGKILEQKLFDFVKNSALSKLEEWPDGKGARHLTGLAWLLISASNNKAIETDLLEAVKSSSMTMSKYALEAIKMHEGTMREVAMNIFYERWKDNSIVLDTWFYLKASSPSNKSLSIVKELLDHPNFDYSAPNSLRALLGGFISNTLAFHSSDGSGYEFISEQVIAIDRINPIVASKLVKSFSHWKNYLPLYSSLMSQSIMKISSCKLSRNTREVVDLIST
tara:strand:- start:4356 stop:6968 length:2613 start_codon:yes stop_codon:yes gene_type:complete